MSRLLHVNINTKDWKRLASFYEDVFGCRRILPEKSIKGAFATQLTGLKDVEIEGVSLEFPDDIGGGCLELFQYNVQSTPDCKDINYTGFGHIAVEVENIDQVTQKVLNAGGSLVGDQVQRTPDDQSELYIHYVRDCEGNIIELMETKHS